MYQAGEKSVDCWEAKVYKVGYTQRGKKASKTICFFLNFYIFIEKQR